ncbi:GDP-mannose 4,6-dehydratase [Aeribacillus alveayuensis]|uniref:GDP-4-dehydro-6-deoxy-D-mannose reductase n=1 Tax=Aeribacillus alveayuensis TaxID=279215 RepID=A0ABT9VNI8_9BACI|nr:GDP-4-dehydro-6-deoxy-D-mannose reductase [Bacillus alveayuensis]
MRILVTGASGFVGKWLVTELMDRGHEVIAAVRKHNSFLKHVRQVRLDLLNYENVKSVLRLSKPDAIVHLAAQSMVKKAWENPSETIQVNVIGTTNLVQAVKDVVPPYAKIITVGSSEEYGLTAKSKMKLTEEDNCLPQNPYAISKLAAGQLAIQLAKKENLNVAHLRPFNHFGPGQREGFVVSDFASQLARLERSKGSTIFVGDLSAQRDFTDVRDIVDAYVKVIEKEVPTGIYNISSGKATPISEILNILLKHVHVPIEVSIDSARFRPAEVPVFVGDSSKIRRLIGWEPKRKLEDSLIETLEWWRTIIKNEVL